VALSSVKDEEYDRLRQAGVERVITGFGMTETCSNWATTRMTQPEEARRASRWLPYPGLDVRVVDHETGEQLPPGEVGELRVRGWNVTMGYLLATSGKDDDGFFRTGDLGRLHADGTVTFAGRIKGMIKTGGENVVAHEVEETVLREEEDVRTAVVVGIPDKRWGEMVVAFVELEPGSELDVDAIRERCRGTMAGYKVPKRFFRVDPGSWPLMPAGKLDRPALTARAVELLREATDL
jgi:fatty-acyl-CoA synthase